MSQGDILKKTRLSVELVPRSRESFLEDIKKVKNNFPRVDTINIPDIVRYELRSWEGCAVAKDFFSHTIPHIRAVDVNRESFPLIKNALRKNGVDEVLVISGDTTDEYSPEEDTPALKAIAMFKTEMPEIKIYAGIDPYRYNLQREHMYMKKKLAAGVAGFFTQPFFDLHLMEVYADWLPSIQVFWGVSPVTSEKSLRYWAVNNKVVFPSHFRPVLEWNKEFARGVLEFARARRQSVYFMPIRVDVGEYLKGVL